MKLKFVISKYRKNYKESNFKPELSPYWQNQLDDMFKGWSDESAEE